MAKRELNPNGVADIQALIESGDVKLSAIRSKFKTALPDDKLMLALASQTDDDDDELRELIAQLEGGNLGNIAALTAPTSVAGFKAGQLLDTTEDMAAYWRAVYSEAKEGANLEHLSDETIVSLAGDIVPVMADGEYADADEYILEVLTALEQGGEETDVSDVPADLKAVALKIGNNATVREWIDKVISGQKDVDAGPAFIAKELLTLDKQELAVISWPGSDTGNNPDITKGTRIVAGKSTKFTHSKVKDFISLQPRVSALLDQIKKVSETAEGQKATQEQQTRARNLNTSVTAATRAYTFAIKAALMMAHLEDHPHITMEWREEDGDISKWKYCIDVGNRHKVKEYGAFTIPGITKLAPSQIPSTMGYDALIEALKRKKKPDPSTTKYPMPDGVNDMDDMLSTVVHSLETPSLWSQLTVALSTRIDSDGKNKEQAETADDMLRNLYRLAELASDATKRHMKRIREIQAADAKAGGVPERDEQAA